MDYKIAEAGDFNVIGLSVKTKNDASGKAQKDIGELFGRLIEEDLIDLIPGKLTYEIYCVYTGYEGDHNEEYTTIVGCKTESLDEIPQDFTGIKIEKSLYRHYKAEGGGPEKVAQVWENIRACGADRKFSVDFDVYGEEPDVNIYVSVNENKK